MSKMPRILLLGANGQVGWELKRSLLALGEVISSDRTHLEYKNDIELDLGDEQALLSVLKDVAPDMIVNASAYTAVDLAEQEESLAHQVNAVLPAILGKYCYKKEIPFIHYSTDYIFDGHKRSPYLEEDKANPQGVYGASKLLGEEAIIASQCAHLILRTSWVYGARGKNFLLTMLKLARQHDRVKVVADQVGSPTWSKAIANSTAALLACHQRGAMQYHDTYHLTCQGQCSWAQFAEMIFALTKSSCQVDAITTDEYPTAAQRPAYTVLSNAKLEQYYGLALPSWQKCLSLCLEELNGNT